MSERIKVMQIGSPQGLYGAERWILALIKYLNKSKIQTWVGAIKDDAAQNVPLCNEAEKMGFPTVIFQSYGRLSFQSITMLRKFIKKNNIDILHTHGYKTDIIGLLAVIGTKCKIVSTPHGWTAKPGFKLMAYELFDRLIFNWFDAVVPLSEELFRPLKKNLINNKNVYLVQNSVDVGEIDSCEVTASDIESFKKNYDFLIGYIGRLVPGKGLDVLLKALTMKGSENWCLVIVGQGEQSDELESLTKYYEIDDRVLFTGYRKDRIALLRSFDVFILPSKSEGIPRCLMEAMAAGIPVVASDITGCRYLVTDMENGLLFKQNQPGELFAAIKRIQNNSKLKTLLKNNARTMIIKRFTSEKMAEEYQNIFIKLIDKKQIKKKS